MVASQAFQVTCGWPCVGRINSALGWGIGGDGEGIMMQRWMYMGVERKCGQERI